MACDSMPASLMPVKRLRRMVVSALFSDSPFFAEVSAWKMLRSKTRSRGKLRGVSRDRVAQRDDVALAGASGEPDTVESPVRGVADGAEGRRAVRRAEGGEIRRRVDPCVGQGQPARAHGDRRRSVLDRQRVVARERGSGVQFKDVAWERGVEGGLEVRARGHPGLRLDGRGEQREGEDEGGADHVPRTNRREVKFRQLDDAAAAGGDWPSRTASAGPIWHNGMIRPKSRICSGNQWSGLRESNPSDWLGKPGHYHYAKPARGCRTPRRGPPARPSARRQILAEMAASAAAAPTARCAAAPAGASGRRRAPARSRQRRAAPARARRPAPPAPSDRPSPAR